MKQQDLRAILEDAELSIEDKMAKIQAINGQDVGAAKSKSQDEIATLTQQLEELKTKNTELESNASKYSDYEELLNFKNGVIEKEMKQQRVDFLKGQGAKHPDLFIDKIDWDKLTYNEETKKFEGENLEECIKGLKDTYSDLFENTSPVVVNVNPSTNSTQELSGVEAAFYKLNPQLMPNK